MHRFSMSAHAKAYRSRADDGVDIARAPAKSQIECQGLALVVTAVSNLCPVVFGLTGEVENVRPSSRRFAVAAMVCAFGAVCGPLNSRAETVNQARAIGLLEQYASGNYDAAVSDLVSGRQLPDAIRDFRTESDRWIQAATDGERLRRSGIVATLVVDLQGRAVAGTFGHDDYVTTLRPLLEWTCVRLRGQAPSELERFFYLASIGLLQGADDRGLLIGERLAFRSDSEPPAEHILHAGRRFPGEGRFKLAWVTVRSETYLIASSPLPPRALTKGGYGLGRFEADRPSATADLEDTLRALGTLVNDLGVGQEAQLRRAVIRRLMDQPDAAAGDLDRLIGASDVFIRYLAHLLRGIEHDRRGDLIAAAADFRQAVLATPAASALTALAGALYRMGSTQEAAEVLTRIDDPLKVPDPWLAYGDRDYRLFPDHLARMRAMIRQ